MVRTFYAHKPKMRIFASQTHKAMKTRNIIIAFFALTLGGGLGSCQNQPQTLVGQIDQLKQQVVADSTALHKLKTVDCQKLNTDFVYCDSLLQYLSQEEIEAAFGTLNLTQAYLHQFGEVHPFMTQKMRYLLLQLDLLKADAESQYLSDSLVLAYLDDESRVADTLHNQVAYFKDRFDQCQKGMKALKKNHR